MEQQILDNDLQMHSDEINHKWAGFWIRVGASLIDVLVFLPFIGLNMHNLYTLKSLPLQLIVSLAFVMYKPFMEYKYGATLGKMGVGIKVVNLEFGKLTLSQSIIRNFPYWLSQLFSIFTTILLYNNPDFQSATSMIDVGTIQNEVASPWINYLISTITLISCIVVAFSAKKQGLHDMIAKTYCIYK
jgi:uncharacterized RDD family membrane protein YckC